MFLRYLLYLLCHCFLLYVILFVKTCKSFWQKKDIWREYLPCLAQTFWRLFPQCFLATISIAIVCYNTNLGKIPNLYSENFDKKFLQKIFSRHTRFFTWWHASKSCSSKSKAFHKSVSNAPNNTPWSML